MSAAQLRAWQLPMRWPEAARASDGLLKGGIVAAMLAVTLLDRFGLRISADYSIAPGLIALYAMAAVMLASGAAALDPRGAPAYLGVVSVAALSYLVNASLEARPLVSLPSFLLLFVLYAPFVVALRPASFAPGLWRWSAKCYVAFALLLAAAGIAQFFAQFVFGADWLFDYTPLIPEALRASGGWNTAYATDGWIKSNGFFLREPSIFSTAMAFALLCELGLERRKWAMALFALALVLSYSGSGLLCLAVALLFPLGSRSVLRLLACLVVAAAAYLVLGEPLNLAYTLERVTEIADERSSAYCRFVYPGAVALRELDSNAWASLLGHGPGTMVRMGATCADGHQTTYAKILFEYGLAGALAFGALIGGALARSAAPLSLRVALALTWLLLGGNLLDPAPVALIYVLSAMWPTVSTAEKRA